MNAEEWKTLRGRRDEFLGDLQVLASSPVPNERYEEFSDLPWLLHEMWREFGFATFADSYLYLTDPVEWQPAVDAWGSHPLLRQAEELVCVARSCFGHMVLWSRGQGYYADLDPMHGVLSIDFNVDTDYGQNFDVAARLARDYAEPFGELDDDNGPIHDRCVAKLGVPQPDEVFAFVPALALGGPLSIENLALERAVPHIVLLSDLTELSPLSEAFGF